MPILNLIGISISDTGHLENILNYQANMHRNGLIKIIIGKKHSMVDVDLVDM